MTYVLPPYTSLVPKMLQPLPKGAGLGRQEPCTPSLWIKAGGELQTQGSPALGFHMSRQEKRVTFQEKGNKCVCKGLGRKHNLQVTVLPLLLWLLATASSRPNSSAQHLTSQRSCAGHDLPWEDFKPAPWDCLAGTARDALGHPDSTGRD